ncbi:MAG TPA: YIP1 family protein [Desulfotomaculum sp.]|nr:YIP1 family protein [Desulfotomaculum sp.]
MSENNGGRFTWRFSQVLISPAKAFEEIIAAPAFLKPALLLCAISTIAGVILAPKVRALTEWMLTQGPAALPPGEAEKALAVAPDVAAVGSVVSAAVFPWAVWLLVTGLLKLFAMFSARETPFKALFAVAVYGYVPILLGGIVTTLVALNVPVENIQNVSISLAAFLPVEKSFWYFFLTRCSPFTWWSLVLWGIGGAAAMKTRPGALTVYLFALWVLSAMILAGLSFLSTPPGMA